MLDTGNDDNEEAGVLTINTVWGHNRSVWVMTGFGLSCW